MSQDVFGAPITFDPIFEDSFSVAGEETLPTGVAFSPDGTKMFVVGSSGANVIEYTLGTAFDVSTGNFTSSFSVAGEEALPTGVAFSPDGTKMFVVGNSGDDVNEYTLGTAFDVSTATFVDSFSVADVIPTGVAFSPDGTKMFVVGNEKDDVIEYTLGTAFDVSTANFTSSFSVAGEDPQPESIAFSPDGTKMFVVGSSGDNINEYILSAAFNVTTATFVKSVSVAVQETAPTGFAFSIDGTKMFVVGLDGDNVNEYLLFSPFTFSPFAQSFSVGPEHYGNQIAFSSDGSKMFILGSQISKFEVSTPFDVSTASFVDSSSVVGGRSGLAFSSDGTKMFLSDAPDQDVDEFACEAWNVSTCEHIYSLSIGEDEPSVYGLAFTSDGSKMFVGGGLYGGLHQYTLSTPFDLSSASRTDFFSTSPEEIPRNHAFSYDGKKMLVIGDYNLENSILFYTMTTPFDVFDSTYEGHFSIPEAIPTGVALSANGAKMFVVDGNSNSIDEYNIVILPSCYPPASGDWVVSSTCTLPKDATAFGSVVVPNGVLLTIPNGITLDIDFATKNLTVQHGGGVLIKSGGKIT